MDPFDDKAFFELAAKLPALTDTDPRLGCIARTQIVGSLLHERGQAVGRAWILPVYESSSFIAPLFDGKGQPARIMEPEDGIPQMIRWRFHCATILLDLPEQPVIDFPLFGGPVRLETWFSLFNKTQERFTLKGQEVCDLRVVSHAFADIPHRQVLRYNPQAERQNKLLPPHRLAAPMVFSPLPRAQTTISFERHKGDYRPKGR